MKRVIGAVALLLIVVSGCIASYIMEKEHFEQMIGLAEQADACYRAGDPGSAQQSADRLAEAFAQRSRLMALFLPHTSLTEAEKSIQGLTLILPYGEPKDFTAEARRCRLLLQRLWEQEKPIWENVL